MGPDIAMNIHESAGRPEGMLFKDWLQAERVARGWSFKEFATQLKHAAGEMSGLRPRVTSIETLLHRWEGGRSAISDAWLLVVAKVFSEVPATDPARDASKQGAQNAGGSGRG